ncbi:MAG TPA: hypothetical protein VFC92_11095 [Bacteroidales bacterium]|nr:hypothetical protein [Bacteroidales bacterium]
MKKLIYTLIAFLVLQSAAISQTAIISEDFSNPVGWEMQGNWMQEDGYLMLYYYPIVTNYDFSAYTNAFDVPAGGGEVVISTFLDVYAANVTDESCIISVVSGDNETELWNRPLTEGPFGTFQGSDLTLSLDDFSGQNVRLRFRSLGASTSALWGWFIFNINLTTWFEHELSAMQINGPMHLGVSQEGIWEVNVKNQGLSQETGFIVNLHSYKSREVLASTAYNGNLGSGETATLNINYTPHQVHNTMLYATIDAPQDEYPANNKSSGYFLRVQPETDYNILFWNNDNGIESVVSPETGQLQQPHVGLKKALQMSGINFDYVYDLPEDLVAYDLVITTMGNYCLS